ncbi:MAG: RagB/SusD family nutrient uptake outer membrane protein [Longimicrobiales bacterium]|nr:RagB/SusD family nutrient uptake outer membrane protein [Longimicrobiales bacterium]
MHTNLEKHRRLGAFITVAAAVQLSACNFDVTNPGPVQDSFLNDSLAFVAIVNGMGRDLSDGLNYLAFHGAMPARELHPTGGTGQFGISPKNGDGYLDVEEQGAPWNQTQRARWTAEDGIRRMTEIWGTKVNSSALAAQAYLWAGYSNRALGENMCEAVIDGGANQPRTVFLTTAEAHFSKAIEVGTAAGTSATATTIVTAAKAGRASVRMHLGNWAGAVSDAAGIANTFAYRMPYYNRGDDSEFNRIAWASFQQPYKTHTVWGTWYETYFKSTNDARVKWTDSGVKGDGSLTCCGSVPFYKQAKHALRDSPINLSSGREMRLIEAEDQLVKGNWQAAMTAINSLRTSSGAATLTATSLAEAWTFLKRERGIEFWLEARRLGDLNRWKAGSAAGALDPREVAGSTSHLTVQDLCFPIPRGERDTNPNIR